MIGVNRAALHCAQGILDEARFIERVGMNGDLDIEFIRHAEAGVDRRRRGAPIFVQLQADGAGADLLAQRLGAGGVSLAEEAEIHRIFLRRFQHPVQVPGPRRAGRRVRAGGWSGAAADHGGDAAGNRLGDLLRANEMNVAVDSTGGEDAPLPGDHFRGRTDDHGDAVLKERISRVAQAGDAPVFDADIGFDDSRDGVDDERVGDDEVKRLVGQGQGRLPHAVADDFATAEFHLIAVAAVFRNQVAFHFDPQIGIGEPHLVAHGGTEHFRVSATGDFQGHGLSQF
jgi:hypothetical protein